MALVHDLLDVERDLNQMPIKYLYAMVFNLRTFFKNSANSRHESVTISSRLIIHQIIPEIKQKMACNPVL